MNINLFADETNGQVGRGLVDVPTVDPNAYASIVGHAVLYLFGKKYVPDQFRRAHTYKFGDAFIDDLQEYTASHIDKPAYPDSHMPNSAAAREAVLPSLKGHHVGLNRMSDFWTFVLVVDKGSGGGVFARAHAASRMLYTGWIANDEPAALAGAQWVLNPNAILSISHHTVLSAGGIIDAAGMNSQFEVTSNRDFADSSVLSCIETNGEQLYTLDPSKVANSIVGDMASGSFSMAPDVVKIGAQDGTIETVSRYEDPIQHLRRVVEAFPDSRKDLEYDGFLQGNGMGGSLFSSGPDVAMQTFSMHTQQSNVMVRDGDIDPGKPITIGEIQSRFGPALDYQIVVPEFNPTYELSSAEAPSRRNVFSALISTSIPDLAVGLGICDLSFRYNSTIPQEDQFGYPIVGGERGAFHLMRIGTIHNSTEAQTKHAWSILSHRLKTMLWPVIQSECGNFDVTVSYSFVGNTLVNLALLDELPEQGLIETNNLLGGLNSPLVGSRAELMNNQDQLTRVVSSLCSPEASGMFASNTLMSNGTNLMF